MGIQADFLQSLGWAVFNSLWQFALLWLVYQLLISSLKNKPAAKSFLATTMLLIGFGWFLVTLFSTWFYSSNVFQYVSVDLFKTLTDNYNNQWLEKSLPAASIIYLSLLLLPVYRFIKNYRYVQIIRHYGLSKLPVEWRMFVNKTAAHMNIKKPVLAWVSDWVSSPVTIGFWKPVILIPLAAINNLTPQQLEAVLLHELSHIKRSDYLINLIINCIKTILYFNPFVNAFVKIIEREREKSCDEMVLQFQYDSYEYANALLTLEKVSHLSKPFAMSAAGKQNDLLHRIETILGVKHKTVFSFNKIAGLFAALVCFFMFNALLNNKKSTQNFTASVYTEVTSPASFFTNDEKPVVSSDVPASNLVKASSIYNQKKTTEEQPLTSFEEVVLNNAVIDPEIINASLEMVEQMPFLNKYEEQQVKEAITASKKVLEEVEWKKVERDIAAVFSQQEKEKLKSTYEKELNKVDWKQWENKLRQAYDKVDWEKVNDQLSNAVSMVRIDSLQRVYSDAINKLDIAKKEMAENNLSGIPDTDVTLKEVEQKRKDLLRLNNYLKAVKNKKIVRL